ncbi:MAG: toll/interleukin-1 receptor domain-containing protein [Flavobacteriales bacterium]|nr:toll/interleukin-1 receptor domain-containing protein [Flavobacteriales bacterium]
MTTTIPSSEYDLFISYAHQGDNSSREAVAALVGKLHDELEADFRQRFQRDLEIFFDKEDIKDFDHWQVRCHRALRSSRFFIACLSRSYLRSDACRWEWEEWCRHEVQHGLVGQGAASLWFVQVEALDAPEDAELLRRWKGDLLQRFHIQCHEWRHDDPAAFLDASARAELAQLTEHVAQRLRLLAVDRARNGNLPWPNTNFVGREPELAQLRTALIDAPSPAPAGLHGFGGMGKTALALAFAHHAVDDFPGGCWLLRCEGREDLVGVFRTLVYDLGLSDKLTEAEKLDDALAVGRVFDLLRPRGPALFLLDNVDKPALLAPEQMDFLKDQPWARLLYTTRLAPDDFERAGAEVRQLSVDRLPDDQAIDLIRRYQPEQSFISPEYADAALEIVQLLAGLTLAVETAAVYLGQSDARVAPPEHAVDMRAYVPSLREDLRQGGIEGVSSQLREVTATLRPTLARLDDVARTALQLSALVGADAVALPWLRAIAGQRHPELAVDAPVGQSDPWTQLIRTMIGMRIFLPMPEPKVVSIHRVLHRVLETQLREGRTGLEEKLAEHIRFRNAKLETTTEWVAARWEFEPLEALAEVWAANQRTDAAWLCNQTGLLWYDVAEWKRAEPLMRRALDIDEKSSGTDHPRVAIRLSNLAGLLLATNRFAEAEPMMRRALDIDEKSYGSNHPLVAKDLNNLAQLLKATNRLAEAEPLMRRALVIDEKSYGSDHPSVAIRLNNQAQLLQATNQLAEAEPLMRRALDIDEKSHGPDHPSVARDLNNLAALLQATNRLIEAEPLMRRALDIYEESYGPDHPNAAVGLSNLAGLLQDMNRLAEAEPLMLRALDIDEKSYGTEHPSVAVRLNNLAQLLQATNRLAEAEPLMLRALGIDEKSYGSDHPSVARDLNNLAHLLQATNRLAGAEPMMRRHLAIYLKFSRTTGHRHQRLQAALKNYSGLLDKMGHSQEEIHAKLHELAPEFLPFEGASSTQSQQQQPPERIRGKALEFFNKGEFAKAEELLRHLLKSGFEPSGTRHHLARLCLITDRLAEAREHVAEGWAVRATAKPYLIPRLLWFQVALEMLEPEEDSSNASLQIGRILGQLKTALQNDGSFMEWTMEPVLLHLKDGMSSSESGIQNWELLSALIDALGERAKMPELDRFSLWREAHAEPLGPS